MADDLKQRDGRDRAWVNRNEAWELEEAAKEFLQQHPTFGDTPENRKAVISYIHAFPDNLLSVGRVPRDALISWLNKNVK